MFINLGILKLNSPNRSTLSDSPVYFLNSLRHRSVFFPIYIYNIYMENRQFIFIPFANLEISIEKFINEKSLRYEKIVSARFVSPHEEK